MPIKSLLNIIVVQIYIIYKHIPGTSCWLLGTEYLIARLRAFVTKFAIGFESGVFGACESDKDIVWGAHPAAQRTVTDGADNEVIGACEIPIPPFLDPSVLIIVFMVGTLAVLLFLRRRFGVCSL